MTTQLNPETEKYIADKVSSGLYASSRDVIEAGIHLLQKYEDTVVPSTSTEEKLPVSGIVKKPDSEQDIQAKIAAGERFLRELGRRYKQEALHGAPPKPSEWPPNFIEETYGSLADDPIELLPQGDYPKTDPIL